MGRGIACAKGAGGATHLDHVVLLVALCTVWFGVELVEVTDQALLAVLALEARLVPVGVATPSGGTLHCIHRLPHKTRKRTGTG